MKAFFQRLRNRKNTKPFTGDGNVSTIPLSEKQIQAVLSRSPHFEPDQLVAGCGQSSGKQRDHNEDTLFALSIGVGSAVHQYPLGLFIVADGMGGHQYGEVASSTAVRTLVGHILRKMHPYLVNPSYSMDESLQDIMRAGVNEAQRAVMQAAPGSGTTLTAALVLGQQMTIGHVGDSRAYAIRQDGQMEPLTRDHSLVRRLEELGQITSKEAAAHPQRNVLYRALGQGDILEPDIFTAPFPQPGYLMLCSDGLWSVVTEHDIHKIIHNSSNLQTACQGLVAAANEAGGPDNISVVLVRMFD
ncbi:MAG: PP2C family serine/threonine-protein phosphatase [Chloroflexota bacterium]